MTLPLLPATPNCAILAGMSVTAWFEWREGGASEGGPVFSPEPLSPLAPFDDVSADWPNADPESGRVSFKARTLQGARSTCIAGRAGLLTHGRFGSKPDGKGIPYQQRPPVTIIAQTEREVVPGTVEVRFALLRPMLQFSGGRYAGTLSAELAESSPVPLTVRPDKLPVQGKNVLATPPIDPLDLVEWLRSQVKAKERPAHVISAGEHVVHCQQSEAPRLKSLGSLSFDSSELNGPEDHVPGIGKAFRDVLSPDARDARHKGLEAPRLQSIQAYRGRRLSLAWVHTEEYGWSPEGNAVAMFPHADAISTLASNLGAHAAGVELRGGAMLGRFAFLPKSRLTGWFGPEQSYASLKRESLVDFMKLTVEDRRKRLDQPWPPQPPGAAANARRETLAASMPSARQVALSGGLCVVRATVTATLAAEDGVRDGAEEKSALLGSTLFLVRDPADVLALTVHSASGKFLAMRTGAEGPPGSPPPPQHVWMDGGDWLAALQIDRNTEPAGWAKPREWLWGKTKPVNPDTDRWKLPVLAILGCNALHALKTEAIDALDPNTNYAPNLPEPAACMILGFAGEFGIYERPRYGTPRTGRKGGNRGTVAFLAAQGAIAGVAIQAALADRTIEAGRTRGASPGRLASHTRKILQVQAFWACVLAPSRTQVGLVLSRWGGVEPSEEAKAVLPAFDAASSPDPREIPQRAALSTGLRESKARAEKARAALWATIEDPGKTSMALAEQLFAEYVFLRFRWFAELWREEKAFQLRSLR